MNQPGRPRVAMVVSGDSFSRDWAAAADRAAEVVRVVPVRRLAVPPRPGLAHVGRRPGAAVEYEVEVVDWHPSRVFGPLALRVNGRRLRRALVDIAGAEGPIDLVHAHFASNARGLPAMRRALGIPYVLTEHGSRLMARPGAPVPPAVVRRAAPAYRSAAAVVVVSSALGRALSALGVPGTFPVVANPVDAGRFGPRPPRPLGPLRMVAVGALIPRKGFDVLLEAVAAARESGCEVTLAVAGAGELEAQLVGRRHELGLDGAVRFLGALDREGVAELLAGADALVSASRMETFGVAIAEALCAGLPVVATAVGGVPEVIPDGCGLLVPVDDVAALAGAIGELAATVDRYDQARISAAARARFSYDAVGARLAEVYRAALAPGPG